MEEDFDIDPIDGVEVKSENQYNDYEQGRQAGYLEGYEAARAELLVEFVKVVYGGRREY